jgi:tRNA wybutosine-synthesizing protein 1
MMDSTLRRLLEKQQYRIVGNNSAVKICSWTKKSLKDQGVCYKEKFYGIRSHLCCQMTPDVNFCQNSCVFCWRNLEGTEKDNKKMLVDDPILIIEETAKAQNKLLEGFKGDPSVTKKKYFASNEPMHYAISLSGEPTLYPKLAELIKELHKRKKTTFLVTNGLMPEALRNLEKNDALPTQLYISIDAPNKELFFKIDRCSLKNGWELLMHTLDIVKSLKDKTRTTLRITAIKGLNMINPEEYGALIKKSDATFVEVKAYMHVGSSRERLTREHMPMHEDIRKFAKEICKKSGYKIIDEQIPSRVVLLMKKDRKDRIMKF